MSSTSSQSVSRAVDHLLTELSTGSAACAERMAALCRDRAAELAAIPVPLAASLVRRAVKVAAGALCAESGSARSDMLATLRHMLLFPSLREVAIKASRLRSLSLAAIDAARRKRDSAGYGFDEAAAAVVRLLRDVGVDVASVGTLEGMVTPLFEAVAHSLLNTMAALVEAGADVNGMLPDGFGWPLLGAVLTRCDESMAWLLEHGASLVLANINGRTVAHALAVPGPTPMSDKVESADFCSRWLRRVVIAEPSLLNARNGKGCTPLLLAANAGSEACVGSLLELGAGLGAMNEDGMTALACACDSFALPVVRQLIAAGAASAVTLPPGSPQARTVQSVAASAAVKAERGCRKCAGRCRRDRPGNCADGLDILRAVLAAGVREAVDGVGLALGPTVLSWTFADESERISAEHALAVLQALHAAGVDVLARGPADTLPVLHAAVAANAPAVVRWLVAEAGAPLEERDSDGYTPLLCACRQKAWAAAQALLDCGARVDVQSPDAAGGFWPVLLAVRSPTNDYALLRRILAADRGSLLRRATNGLTVLHLAAATDTDALSLLLGSGLPHLAINAVVSQAPMPGLAPACIATPLHCACDKACWDAALALLAAGARVDIAGGIDGRLQTVAEWARSSPACKHRGVKRAVAARAREHAAEAAAAATGLPSSGSGSDAGVASAAASVSEKAEKFAGRADSATDASLTALPGAVEAEALLTKKAGFTAGAGAAHAGAGCATGSAGAAAVGTLPANGKGKQPKGRKSRRGAPRNRAEEASDAAAAAPTLDHGTAAESASIPPPAALGDIRDSGAGVAAAPVATAGLNTCEDPSAAGAVDAPQHKEPVASALAVSAAGNAPEGLCVEVAAAAAAAAAGDTAPAWELARALVATAPGAALVICPSTAPEAVARVESAGESASSLNTCEPGTELGAGFRTCEPGEGATSASTAPLQAAGCGEAADSAGTAGAALIAALQDEGASAAAVRPHLAALSELARDPAAAAALERQGAISAIGAALLRHGVSVAVAAGPLVTQIGNAIAGDGEEVGGMQRPG